MNKRPYQDDEPDSSLSKRARTFDAVSNGWRDRRLDASPRLAHGDYTIAWICALPLELTTSRKMLDEEHQLLPSQPGDDNAYVLGCIDQHNVVMACLPGQYGTNNAAIVATDLKRSFPNICATLMVGIGGGAPSIADLRLGDVVVGTRVIQYDMGKDVGDGMFEITAHPKTPLRRLSSVVMNLRAIHDERDASSARVTTLLRNRLTSHARPSQPDRLFQASYEHIPGAPTCHGCNLEKVEPRRVRVSDEPKIFHGVIASGNRVMRNARARDDTSREHSVLCFEMEAAGMMDNLQCLPIRGICDYSDSHKNKDWQRYAAATAAAYARELLEALPPTSGEPGRATTYLGTMSKSDTVVTHNDQDSERRQQLLESLDFPQIDARKTTIRAAYTKTCRWFLCHSKYQDWLDPRKQSENHGFLWMRGKAGAGKSTMMKFIYLETKKKSNNIGTVVASFFFNARGDYLEKSVTGMYRSLLTQLLRMFPDLQYILDDTDIVPSGQKDCPNLNALKGLLEGAVMSLGKRSFTCFIDALDECDEQEVRDMVQFFEELTQATTDASIQFRICFSSRPYPYIDIRPELLLTLEEEAGHAEDLTQYVKSHLRIANLSLLAELQAQILGKAAGIFMWIVLVVDILNRESNHGALALRKKLAEIPARLSDLFRSILTRDQDNVEWLLLCVLWVLCAKRPLSPAEFRHALWAGLLEQDLVDPDLPYDTDMDALKLVTSSSKGLAEVTKSKQPTVQFIHESVRDFLVKENGLQELWPDLGFEWESRSHEKLQRCCRKYLCLPGVQAVFNRPEEEDVGDMDALAGTHPFLEYASQQVLHHANVAAVVIPQDNFLSHFFASAGIRVINLFEKFKSRRYSPGATALYVLSDKGWGNLIRTRLEKETAVYVPGERYEYPLFAALANGHKDAVAALLGLPLVTCDGVNIMQGLKHRKDLEGYQGRTPLSWATQEGRLSIVKALIDGRENANENDRLGYAPLRRAMDNEHWAVVRLLIDNGVDVNAPQSNDGRTAVTHALVNGHEAVARLLIDNGADVNASQNNGGWTALMHASASGHEAMARLLIDNGADVNASQNNNGWTALTHASASGHEAVARLLIDNGADVNAQSNDGQTVLIYTSSCGHEAVARLLIDNGADVNAQSNDGRTVLIYASSYGHEAVARLLIVNGADVNAKNSDGSTALIYPRLLNTRPWRGFLSITGQKFE